MADTIKKKKLTIMANRPQNEIADDPSTVMTDILPAESSGAIIPENPLTAQRYASKAPSYTLYAILGLLACLCFVALLLIQWMELSYYAQPPSLWPVS